MKKIISVVLTVSMIFGTSSVAFAKPKEKIEKPAVKTTLKTEKEKDEEKDTRSERQEKADNNKKTDNKNKENKKNDNKKTAQLDKSKDGLLKKCDKALAQINKLKSYIISEEGNLLIEAKDLATGDAAIEGIDEAIDLVNEYKERIEKATTSKELKDISKELQKGWMKNQNFVKRITGLTSTARLKKAYDDTLKVVDRLGAGINGITTNAAISLDKEALKKDYEAITQRLEEAHDAYLEAVARYSSMTTDGDKSNKEFKDAHFKLMEAKDGIHDVLIGAKQLLVKIKTSLKDDVDDEESLVEDIKEELDDDDDDGDEKDDDEAEDEKDD